MSPHCKPSKAEAIRQQALLRLLRLPLRVQTAIVRQLDRIEQLLGGIAMSALDADHLSRLTADIYNYRRTYKEEGLFDWEEKWFVSDLPPPPAKILVGGAGTGREIKHLVDNGYTCVAFDPASNYIKKTRFRFSESQCPNCFVARYEDLFRESISSIKFQKALKEHAPFDAVLLGWSSFTHIPSNENRKKTLDAISQLSPRGPVLLSVWMRQNDSELIRSRAWKIGRRIGSNIQPSTISNSPHEEPGDSFQSRTGYGYFFSMEELQNLAETTGYTISTDPQEVYSGAFPHLTFIANK